MVVPFHLPGLGHEQGPGSASANSQGEKSIGKRTMEQAAQTCSGWSGQRVPEALLPEGKSHHSPPEAIWKELEAFFFLMS